MSEGESWLRRQALQIAAQLPGDTEDAFAILRHVEDIIQFLYCPPDPTPAPVGDDQSVVRFPGGAKTPSRRASSRGKPSALPK